VAVALDAPDAATALRWAAEVGPHVAVIKVGLELFCGSGADIARQAAAAAGRPVFLDLKLHDIPNTVAGAARAVAPLAPALLTVHAAGGSDMVRAAVDALGEAGAPTLVTAVTVLTSLDVAMLGRIGLAGTPSDAARRLAVLAVSGGARALVCSPAEAAALRAEVGPDIVLVTPGVRPVGGDVADQRRVATPQAALAAGADLLVIGRPITGAPSPGDAAAAIAAGLRR
jgi:orotidine-5'-phosphate decarboxylase